MTYFNKYRGTKGFISTWERVIRFRYMISEEAKQRVRILAFWERHGTQATCDAFGVSRRTLFRWQQALKAQHGKLDALNKRSTTPKRKRCRKTESWVIQAIISLRTEHPRLGKEKLHALLKRQGYAGSVSTVGRILSDLKGHGKLPRSRNVYVSGKTGRILERRPRRYKAKRRRPKGYRVLEVDTVIRFIDGVKRYILTATDTERHTAFAACYTNHGSASAADFIEKCMIVLPDHPVAVQTDNGSEFARYFDRACETLRLERFHTRVRSPKENAHVERFNRTLSEEFLRYHRALLRDDVATFNDKLVDWLLWYNGERPHHSLGLRAPFQCMMDALQSEECQMWWTNTFT